MTKSCTNLMLIAASVLTLVGGSTANVTDDESQLIPQIEPLLKNSAAAVCKDAQDAITGLRSKA